MSRRYAVQSQIHTCTRAHTCTHIHTQLFSASSSRNSREEYLWRVVLAAWLKNTPYFPSLPFWIIEDLVLFTSLNQLEGTTAVAVEVKCNLTNTTQGQNTPKCCSSCTDYLSADRLWVRGFGFSDCVWFLFLLTTSLSTLFFYNAWWQQHKHSNVV